MNAANKPNKIRHLFIATCIIYWGIIFAPSPQIAATAPQNFVFHLNISGLRPRDLHALVNMGKLPNFARLHTQGAWTHNARIDADTAFWQPNQIAMLTGRPMLTRFSIPNSGHGWMSDAMPDMYATLHRHADRYIASTFDIAHDYGLKTGLYATDQRYTLIRNSFNTANGAADTVDHDDGFDKIDVYINYHHDTAHMMEDLSANINNAPTNYTFVQFHDLSTIGIIYGWDSQAYKNTLIYLDGWLGEIFNLIQSNDILNGNTSIILTTDRAGSEINGIEEIDGVNPLDALNYTVPFFVWGPGIPQNVDLYLLNGSNTSNPGTRYIDYDALTQPIRNGNSANCALNRLGLPSIPGAALDQLSHACGKAPVSQKTQTPVTIARPIQQTPTPIYILVTTTPMLQPAETPMPVAQALPVPTSAPTTLVVQPSNKTATNTQTVNAAPPKPVQQAAQMAVVSAAAPIQKARVAAARTIVAVTPTPLAKSVANMAKATPSGGVSTLAAQLKPIAKPITEVKVAPKTRP